MGNPEGTLQHAARASSGTEGMSDSSTMRMGSIRWEESSTLDQPTLSVPHPDRPPPYNTTSISLKPTTGEVPHLPPRTTSRLQVVSHRGIWTLPRSTVIRISDSEKGILSIPSC